MNAQGGMGPGQGAMGMPGLGQTGMPNLQQGGMGLGPGGMGVPSMGVSVNQQGMGNMGGSAMGMGLNGKYTIYHESNHQLYSQVWPRPQWETEWPVGPGSSASIPKA